MRTNEIREAKASKTTEARAILAKAESESRNLTADESGKFDALKAEITDLESQESRAQFLDDAERRQTGTVVSGSESFANIESRVSLLRSEENTSELQSLMRISY